jgi:hypothetical protein
MRIGILTTHLLAIAGLAIAATAQKPSGTKQPGFETTRPPRGTIHDTDGVPIGGATVQFRVGRGSVDSMEWRDSILRTRPLPRVRSSKDGEFFVPLTGIHRLFTATTAGRISLVVEKAGYHPWIEPLSAGLRGYLGSRVVLRPITAADRFVVEVKNPAPGMRVRVHRFGNNSISRVECEQWYDVPQSGEVSAAMSFVPSPLTVGPQTNFAVPVGIEVQLVYPGRTTQPKSLAYGQKKIVVGDVIPTTRFVCTLAREDKKELEAPRGLYRCPDHVSRWFPVDPANVVESALLPLFALVDDSSLAANVRYIDPSEKTIFLAPVPPKGERAVTLHDASGAVVEGARAYFFDLERLPAHSQGLRLGIARARRRLMAEHGRIDLGGRILPGPGFLWIHAPGYKPHLQFEPRAIAGTKRITLGAAKKSGKLHLRVADQDAKPIAGVYVVLNGASTRYGAVLAGQPRTDRNGEVTIEHLASGNHAIRLTGPGLTEVTTMVRVRGTATVDLRSVLHRAIHYRLLIVDDAGLPIPFRAVRTYATFGNPAMAKIRTQLRTNNTVTSDSLGRILYSDLPAGVLPRVTDQLNTLVRQAMAPLDESVVNKIELTNLELVLIPIPDAPVVRECLIAMNRASNRSLVARKGCGALLVRFPTDQDGATLSIYLRGAPPIRISREILAAARAKQGKGVLFLDQRKEIRRVEFEFVGLGDADGRDMRIELPGMNFVRNQPYLYGNSGLQLRQEKDRIWSVGLRDLGSYQARVLHPNFLLRSLDIPEGGDESSEPLKVELTRGTAVVFRLKSSIPLQPAFKFNLYVHSSTNQMVLYQREKLEESNLRKVGKDEWELRLPFALEPGKYYFSIRVYNTQLNLPRRLFTVPEGGPFLVEINKRTARVSRQDRSPTDIKALTDKIARLEKSAAALRKMGDTDEKSKERLTKILTEIEAQLETHKKSLQKLEAKDRKGKVRAAVKQRDG